MDEIGPVFIVIIAFLWIFFSSLVTVDWFNDYELEQKEWACTATVFEGISPNKRETCIKFERLKK